MGALTMSIAIPAPLRKYVRSRVKNGDFGNVSEFVRDLIRRDQEEHAKQRLRSLIAEGLESGTARPLTRSKIAALRRRAGGKPQ